MPVLNFSDNTLASQLSQSIEALQMVDVIYQQLVYLTAAQQRLVLRKLAERLGCEKEIK